jgi:hypothetical protein
MFSERCGGELPWAGVSNCTSKASAAGAFFGHSRKPPLFVVFITLGEPQAHGEDETDLVTYVVEKIQEDWERTKAG